MEVPLEVELLDITKDPGPLVESIAEISYQTQRFFERKHQVDQIWFRACGAVR